MNNQPPKHESMFDQRPFREQLRDFLHKTDDIAKGARMVTFTMLAGGFGFLVSQDPEGFAVGASIGMVASIFDPMRQLSEMPSRITHNLEASKMTAAERSANDMQFVSVFTGKKTEGNADGSEHFVAKD